MQDAGGSSTSIMPVGRGTACVVTQCQVSALLIVLFSAQLRCVSSMLEPHVASHTLLVNVKQTEQKTANRQTRGIQLFDRTRQSHSVCEMLAPG